MKFVVVTGMSGAGKSTTLKFLEDLGFFCVDNLPPILIPDFAEVFLKKSQDITKIALGIDIRGGDLFDDLFLSLERLKKMGYNYEILFLHSDVESLIKRYKETRRIHPLSKEGSILSGVEKETKILSEVKSKADYIIDTSKLLTRELKEQIDRIFVLNQSYENLLVNIISFGFKYGIPSESDLLVDVRFLPNPYYDADLRALSGLDSKVQKFVLSSDDSKTFISKYTDLLEFLIPRYIKEGKSSLVISIGCTGGRHRSVAVSNKIKEKLILKNHNVTVTHRDIHKDSQRGK